MRAQLVYEALEFERGRDPKVTMGIGKLNLIKEYCNKILQNDYYNGDRTDPFGNTMDMIENFENLPEISQCLLICSYYDKTDFVDFLLLHHKNIPEEIKYHGLSIALIVNKNWDMMKSYLDKGDMNIESKDNMGRSLLEIAIQENNFEIVNKLLDAGADFNKCSDPGSLWIFPISDNDIILVKYLLEQGLDPNMPNKNGQTAINVAASENSKILSLLINSGADAKGSAGAKALISAISQNRLLNIKILLNAEAPIDKKVILKYSNGETPEISPLEYAKERGSPKVIELFKSKNLLP